MTGLIIILILLVAVLGGAGYAVVSSGTTLQATIDKNENMARLETAAQTVLTNIVSVTSGSAQYYAVPMPDSNTSPAVPTWLLPTARTVDGTAFLYCPFSNATSGTKATAITTPGGTYNVNSTTLYSGSQNYVTISDARPANAPTALVILVAPAAKNAIVPDCQNINADLTLAGATVRVITEAEVEARRLVNASNGSEIYTAPATTGDGSGRNAANAMPLDTALTYYNYYRPQHQKLNLSGGSYTVTNAITSFFGTNATTANGWPNMSVRNSSLNLTGAGANAAIPTQISGVTSPYNPLFPANLSVKNLAILRPNGAYIYPQLSAFQNYKLVLDSATIPYFNNLDGRGYLFNAVGLTGQTSYNNGSVYDGSNFFAGSRTYINAVVSLPASDSYYTWALGNAGGELFLGQQDILNGIGTYGYQFIRNIYGARTYISGILNNVGTTLGSQFIISYFGSQNYLSNVVFNAAEIYVNGNIYINGTASATFFDTATINITGFDKPATALVAGHAEIFGITNSVVGSISDSNSRATNLALTVDSNAAAGTRQIVGGANGGWAQSILTSANTACWSATSVGGTYQSTYYILNDTNFNTNTNYSLPLGSSTANAPLLVANRSNWQCLHP